MDARLLTAINGESGNKKQRSATYIMSLLVEIHKDFLSPEAYAELKLRYSKTAEEQKIEKNIKEREKLEQKKKDNELKERDLRLREQNAEGYNKIVKIKVEKNDEAKREDLETEKRSLERKLANGFEDEGLAGIRLYTPEEIEQFKVRLQEVNVLLNENTTAVNI
jgi:hypothetical protein